MSRVSSSILTDYNKLKIQLQQLIYKNNDSKFNIMVSLFNELIRNVIKEKVFKINKLLKNIKTINNDNYKNIVDKIKQLKDVFEEISRKYKKLVIVDNSESNNIKSKVESFDDIFTVKNKIISFDNTTVIDFNSIMDILNYLDTFISSLELRAIKDKKYYQGRLNNKWDTVCYYVFSWLTIPFVGLYSKKVEDYERFLNNNIISSKVYIKNFKRDIISADQLFDEINISLNELYQNISSNPNYSNIDEIRYTVFNVETNITTIFTNLSIT